MAKKKTANRIVFTIGMVLCVIFAVMLVGNLTIIIKGIIHPALPPSVLGVTPMVVQSGSMSGSAKDHIEVGDLIFTIKPDVNKLKAGDIISYMDGQIAVTHRIVAVETGADGKRSFLTKGDANNTDDGADIPQNAVVGKVVLVLPKIGAVIRFVRTPAGVLSLLAVLGLLLELPGITDFVRRKRQQ